MPKLTDERLQFLYANEMTKTDAEAFQRQKFYHEGKLVIWCVTTNTKEFGHRYAARPIVVPNLQPEQCYLIADSLDGIRSKLPHGLTRLSRQPTDDPVIVETWF